MGERVLVTGAAGGIGARLVPALRERGLVVRCLVHRRSVPGADEEARGDLADAASLARAVGGVQAVVHLAAVTHDRDPRAYGRVNLDGTRALLEAARGAGVARFVHVSTRAISPAGGAYSASKLAAERAVAQAGVPFTIVRLPEVYGAGAEGVDRIIDSVRAGRPVPLVGRGRDEVCPVFVDDAIAALAAAAGAPADGQTYTLAGECLTVRAFTRACAEAFGVRERVVPVPRAAVAAASALARIAPLPVYPDQLARLEAPKARPTPEAARADLGFTPRPLRAGLRALPPSGRATR